MTSLLMQDHVILNEDVVGVELEVDPKEYATRPLYAAIDNYHGRIENLTLGQENSAHSKGLGTVEAPDFEY